MEKQRLHVKSPSSIIAGSKPRPDLQFPPRRSRLDDVLISKKDIEQKRCVCRKFLVLDLINWVLPRIS